MRVFYLDHRTGDGVSSDHPVDVSVEVAVHKMRAILDTFEKSFVGIIDAHGQAIQFAPQPGGRVLLDIPDPSQRRSWQGRFSLDDCCAFVAALGERIDVADYPGLEVKPWGVATMPAGPS